MFYDGIATGSPTGLRVVGVRIGNDPYLYKLNGGTAEKTQRYAATLNAGTHSVAIQDCDLRDNRTGTINNGMGSEQIIGYNYTGTNFNIVS